MPDRPAFAARSDVGLLRDGNEDRYLARPPVFAVADGMGGHQAGEVASGIAIDLLEDTADRTATPSLDDVVATIEASNAAIRLEARTRAELVGMGTTCTVVVVDTAIHIAHVGDSRAYRFREGELVGLTDDHSLVASMVREGLMTPADAMTDGRRHVITRALGADDQVKVDVVTADRRAGDRLLLCSDGLHGQVGDEAIATVLRDGADPGDTADRLVELANAAGGDDNVTVIVIDPDALTPVGATETASAPTAPEPRRGRRRRTAVLLIVLVLVVAIILLAVAGWLWYRSTAPV